VPEEIAEMLVTMEDAAADRYCDILLIFLT